MEEEQEQKIEEPKIEEEKKEVIMERYIYVYVKNNDIGGYLLLSPEGIEYLKSKSPNKIKKFVETRCRYIKRERNIKKSEFDHYALVTALIRVQQRYVNSFMEYMNVKSLDGFTNEQLENIYNPPGLNVVTTTVPTGVNKYQELYSDILLAQKPNIISPTDIHKQIFTALTKLTK
jgi:hypothetical protein